MNTAAVAKFVTSRYNIGYADNGYVYLFNTKSGGHLRIVHAKLPDYQWLFGKQRVNVPPKKITSEKIFQSLKSGGFIIPDNVDEIEMLKFKIRLNAAADLKNCSLVIVPTLSCNMKCLYCFEGNKSSSIMSEKVRDDIVQYLHNRLKDGCKNVFIHWFGGEPLICFSVIKSLSKKMIRLCKKYDAGYFSRMTTNGTLLTKLTASELKRCKIKSLQITVDGMRDSHDVRRPYISGRGTFDKIIKNIEECCRILAITVRCNVDQSNLSSAMSLVKHLRERNLSKFIGLYFSPVHHGAKCCQNTTHVCKSTYTDKSFARIEPMLKEVLKENGFYVGDITRPVHSSCMATTLNGFVVDQDGNLYKCSETVGYKDQIIGNISEGPNFNNTYFKWVNFDPFQIRKCRRCKVLPLCFGWCPERILHDQNQQACNRIRFNIIEELKLKHISKTSSALL